MVPAGVRARVAVAALATVMATGLALAAGTWLPAGSLATGKADTRGPASALQVVETARVDFFLTGPVNVRGLAREVSGTLVVDAQRGAIHAAELVVPAAGLTTHLALRDNAMRMSYLHVERYPEITFRTHSVEVHAGETGRFVARGLLSLHGRERPAEIAGKLLWSADRTLEVEGRFSLRLSDYGISRPIFLLWRMDDQVDVEFFLRTAVPRDDTAGTLSPTGA